MIRVLTTAMALALLVPATAAATGGTCLDSQQEEKLVRFEQRLAGARDVNEARRMANRRLQPMHSVLQQARRLAPSDAGLAEGVRDLDALELQIARADSPEQVARAFQGLRPAASADGARCNLTTGETIATVIGFVLGILPGIILLILLC